MRRAGRAHGGTMVPALLDMTTYQRRALGTSDFGQENDPESALAPMLGLAGAAGTVLDLYKRYFNDRLKLKDHQAYLREQLGDVLWYVAVVAKTFDLDLGRIAKENLIRTADRYGEHDLVASTFDREYEPTERFPRRLVVRFTEKRVRKRPALASLKLIEATPNAFEHGPVEQEPGKLIGYMVGAPLGDPLTDNSRRRDDYRYHDAIHLGFLSVLGWSPIVRSLLRVKRKSKPKVDEVEDGARARFLEEGLAAVLYRLSLRRNNFRTENMIGGEVLDMVQALVVGLEVEAAPAWLWRRAINQGFVAMHQLGENMGGYLVADLNAQTLAYSKQQPRARSDGTASRSDPKPV